MSKKPTGTFDEKNTQKNLKKFLDKKPLEKVEEEQPKEEQPKAEVEEIPKEDVAEEDPEKLLKEQREIEKKIQELQKQRDFLGKKTQRYSERKNEFKNPRKEFCFQIKGAKEEDEGRYVNYLKKMVVGMGKKEGKNATAKNFKVLKDVYYFEVEPEITIATINFEAGAKGDFPGFKLEQLRPSKLFDDYPF